MEEWGVICILLSGALGVVREITKDKEGVVTRIYKMLWWSSLLLLLIGIILYFTYSK